MVSALGYVYYDRKLSFDLSRNRLESASAVLVEFVSNTMVGIDSVLRAGGRELARRSDDAEKSPLSRKLADMSVGVSGLTSLFVLSSDGDQIANSRMDPPPKVISKDRSYYTQPVAQKQDTTFVSPTLRSRLLDSWQFYASRLVRGPENEVIGVVCATLDTQLFQDVLSTYRPDTGIEVGLFTTDSQLIARSPADPSQYGRSFSDGAVFSHLRTAPDEMISLIAPGFGDEVDRLTIVRRIPDFPLVLTLSVPTDVALREWRAHARLLLSAASVMSAFIVFAGVAGSRSLRKQEEAASLLDTMFTQTPACIAIARSGGSLIRCNDNWRSLNELFQVPSDIRDDTFRTLRHAVQRSGDHGLTKGRKKALNDINAVTAGAKLNAVLELRCRHEGADRYFAVNISRIVLSAEDDAQGFAVLVVDISRQRALELRLRSQLVTDARTGLANREGFLATLGTMLHRAADDDCLFVFDIVGLAELKEIRGVEISDEAFSAVGARLSALLDKGCLTGRIDSDKFCVFVPGGMLGATPAERLQSLTRHVAHEGHHLTEDSFNVRMTVGGAQVGDVDRQPEKLLQAAELAHGLAKRRGAASSAFFNAKIEADAHERVRLYESLQKAIADNEFELEFQPKVDLASGAIVGAEALVRWRHPNFGLQPPSSFIPMAEESGLIVPIGDWVIGEVVRMLASWPKTGDGPIPISLNVSVVQFDREDVGRTLAEHLERHGIAPGLLTIELTESVFSLELEETVAKINRIRETGVQVSLDDFGTGYSSLSYLNLMNFDELKVDGSFVRKIDTDLVSRSIVEMTLNLARTLNVLVTAEGVETQAQREALLAMGCHTAQGFLFSKSLTAAELQAAARERRRLLPDLF